MKTISKSKYLAFKSCPKSLWLLLNKPELGKEDGSASKRIEDGKTVGTYAKQYFKDTVDTTSYTEDGELDINKMIGLTNRFLLEDKETIAEASFSINNLFCSVDLLHKNGNEYEIYEVKATTKIQDEHYIDAAFQKYVLEQRGLSINKVYILHLNNGYIRHGNIELDKLFIKEDITTDSKFLNALMNIKDDLNTIEVVLNESSEPNVLLSQSCKECPFHSYCHKDLPSPNVLDINGIRGGYNYLNAGIITFSDVVQSDIKLNKRQKVQVMSFLNKEDRVIDSAAVKSFLDTIRYPIYHLDFESIQLPVPPCDGSWPYEQIPTQYSLHIEYENGRLEHKEFLGDYIDPRRAIAESLCENIPENACVLAYNKSFECGRLNELADLFPDLREHLTKISNNVVDLIIPFKNGDFYDIKMGGSNSIKYVLPALYPNDPELDYHALPVVHNGGEAMDIYPKMLESSPEEKEKIRNGLLLYCCLDTLAMVKVLNKLIKYSRKN